MLQGGKSGEKIKQKLSTSVVEYSEDYLLLNAEDLKSIFAVYLLKKNVYTLETYEWDMKVVRKG